jgi:zinc protease
MNLQYRVGSRDEAPGKTGLAHLFEHLMYYGSEHASDGWFPQMAKLGLSENIGQTHDDVTRYAVTIPTGALDAALWLESDRMGYLKGALDQKKLDTQRGVIENEIRQWNNEPYNINLRLIGAATYPPEHPYHSNVLGTFDDLKAASLEDVHEWLRTHYGPNNAVLVLAGDFDPKTIREKVERYFGAIPPGPPVPRYGRWPAPLTSNSRQQVYDRVPSSRVERVWNIPGLGTPEYDYMILFGQALGASEAPLTQRLVKHEKLASGVVVWLNPRELSSSFVVSVTMAPGQEAGLARVEKIVDEEVTRLLASGPSQAELQRLAAKHRFGFLRAIEKVGYYGGLADYLGWGAIFADSPGYYREQQTHIQCATTAQVVEVARKWLSAGSFTLTISPMPTFTARAKDVDRSAVPAPLPTPNPPFPAAQRFRLGNGLSVVVLERASGPVVQANLVIRGGSAADPEGKEGIGTVINNLLVKEAADRGAALGAQLAGSVVLDASVISLSAVRDSIGAALALLGATIRTPQFTPAAVEQARNTVLGAVGDELATPRLVASRVGPLTLYPSGHPYARPLTATGHRETVATISAGDVRAFHSSWFRPNNATIVIAGAVSGPAIRAAIERAFGAWAAAPTPTIHYPPVPPRNGPPVVYLVDAPGATQIDISAGFLAKPTTDTTEIVTELLARVIAVTTTSRLMANLREGKHWAYFTTVTRNQGIGPRPFLIRAAVQPDKTTESIQEIVAELNALQGSRPVSEAELALAQNTIAEGLGSRFETSAGVALAGHQAVIYGFRPDYFATYGDRVRALRPAEVTAAAQQMFTQGVTWLVIGDLSKIESAIRALNLGEVKVIPADARSLPK